MERRCELYCSGPSPVRLLIIPAVLERFAREPAFALRIERFNLRPCQSRHIELDLVTNLRLQIGEMAIAFRKFRQELRIETQLGRRIDGVHAILLVDGLAQHEAPASSAFFEKIEEAAGANDVAQDIVKRGALRDC